ncbi:MAG: hypothetical protein JNM58_17800 [Xanthomonadaceae bacterium]|nr:hypothetical protein [Xanthomonadaceae bacterium]
MLIERSTWSRKTMKRKCLIVATSSLMLACNACSVTESEANEKVSSTEAADFCYRRTEGGRDRQISLEVSGHCSKYAGPYVSYIGDDAVLRNLVTWWAGDGRNAVAQFAKGRGEMELVKLIEAGGQPFFIAYGEDQIARGVEVHFSGDGLFYIVVLSPSDMTLLDLMTWQ